jgi:hypothetical protein
MRKIINRSIIILAVCTLFAGCGTIDKTGNTYNDKSGITDTGTDNNNSDTGTDNGNSDEGTDDGNSDNSDNNEIYTFEAQVIDSSTSILVTPDKNSNEIKSSDKITVSIDDDAITGAEGKSIAKEELKAGDLVKITYNGVILESYPAQITASAVEVAGRNIIIDGYIALIDDIYNEDPGLNGDITTVALDTTEWIGLSAIDKEIILQSMKDSYGLDIIEGTYDELSEQGLIDKEKLYFPKGILISIKNINYNEKDKIITCSIKKWRSGLGAIGSDDVTAEYKDGQWIVTKSNMWIS